MCTVTKIETILYEVEDKRDLPDELETRVSKYWKEQLNSYPKMFNGPFTYMVRVVQPLLQNSLSPFSPIMIHMALIINQRRLGKRKVSIKNIS